MDLDDNIEVFNSVIATINTLVTVSKSDEYRHKIDGIGAILNGIKLHMIAHNKVLEENSSGFVVKKLIESINGQIKLIDCIIYLNTQIKSRISSINDDQLNKFKSDLILGLEKVIDSIKTNIRIVEKTTKFLENADKLTQTLTNVSPEICRGIEKGIKKFMSPENYAKLAQALKAIAEC